MKLFIVDSDGTKTPVPPNTILLQYTGDTQERGDAFNWLDLKLFSVPYSIKSSTRFFNLVIRVGQFGERAWLTPKKLLSFSGLGILWHYASHTHAAYFPRQLDDDELPHLIDILLPETPQEQAKLTRAPMWDIDKKGMALIYDGPYSRLFGELSSTILHSLLDGNVTYNFYGALATVFPKKLNHNFNGSSLKKMYVDRLAHCLTSGWGESEKQLGPIKAYCVQPLLLTKLFALTFLSQMLEHNPTKKVTPLFTWDESSEAINHPAEASRIIKALKAILHDFNRFPTTMGLAQVLLETGLFVLAPFVKEKSKAVKTHAHIAGEADSSASTSSSSGDNLAASKPFSSIIKAACSSLPPVTTFLRNVGLFTLDESKEIVEASLSKSSTSFSASG